MAKFWRYLRVTWTAFCGLACVLLIVLWVRAQGYVEGVGISISGKSSFLIVNCPGQIAVTTDTSAIRDRWTFHQEPAGLRSVWSNGSVEISCRWTAWGRFARIWGSIFIPHWFLISLTCFLAVLPWPTYSNRFGVRALLIAITLVAVVLGLGMYLIR
jgi:hypothetical protein